MTGELLVREQRSFKSIKWDTDTNGGGPLDPVHARAAFDKAMSEGGHLAWAETATTGPEQIRSFDPETQIRVVVSPQLAGGR